MKCRVKTLELLLTKAAQKTNKALNHADLAEMTAEINAEVLEGRLKGVTMSEKYIYDTIYRPFNKMEENDYLNLNKKYVDTIARYAGYENYNAIETSTSTSATSKLKQQDEVIERCGGTWKSYVRTNSGRSELLVAPLHILQENGKTIIKMKGENNVVYDSDLSLKGGCLRCLLDGREKDDRQIYMVMKLGVAKNPKVLLGIFAGMSNGEMPIGGREVWVKQEDDIAFQNLNHQVLNMEADKEEIDENILHYFKKKNKNCWKGTLPSSFDRRDLKND